MRKVTIIGAGPGNPDLLSRAALDQSVLRILQLKLTHGIVDMPESG